MKRLPNIHPGEILNEEFIKGFHITAYKLAKETKMPHTRVSEVLKGKRRITADTALRLSKYFGTTADFWLGLQLEYDLREEKARKQKEINSIRAIDSYNIVGD